MEKYLRSWLINWDNYFSSAIGCSARYVSDVYRMLTPQLKHYISLLQRAITPPNGLDVNDTYVKRFFVSLQKALDILPNLLTKYSLYLDTSLEFIDIYFLCLHCFDLITLQLKDDPYIEIDFQRKKYCDCLRYWGVFNEVEVVVSGGLNETLDGHTTLTMNEEERNEIGGVMNAEENEKEDKKDEKVIDEDLVKEEREFEKDEESCPDDIEDQICKDDFEGDKMVQGKGCDVTSIKADIDKGKEQKSDERIVQGHFQEDKEFLEKKDQLKDIEQLLTNVSKQVDLPSCELSEKVNLVNADIMQSSYKNVEWKRQVRELNEKLQLSEQGNNYANEQYLMLSEPHKAGPFGTVKPLRTNPTVPLDESVNPRLAKLLSEITVVKELIVALANSNVQVMLEIWSSGIKKVGIRNYLGMALDNAIVEFCKLNDVLVYQRDPDKAIDYVGKTSGNHVVSALKFRISREFLQLGYSVLLSDI